MPHHDLGGWLMEIPLSNGGVALVDDADYSLVAGRTWLWRQSHGNMRYVVNYRYIRRTDGRQLQIRTFMHRLILSLDDPRIHCDHRDQDGLNNQRNNLRIATRSQNLANRQKCVTNTTGFKGVFLVKRRKTPTWLAAIKVMYKCHYLGHFHSPVEAALAYDRAALAYFGEFASLNFPCIP